MFPGTSSFLEEISSLSHSIVFLYFPSLISQEVFLISPSYSLELCIQIRISFLFSFTFLFSSFHGILVSPPQTTILPFCISFSWGWSWSLSPVQCHELLSVFLKALGLSDLISWICLSLPLYNRKGFYLIHTWTVYWFSLLLQFKTEFYKKKFMIWATVNPWSCFGWLYKASPFLAAKNIINLILVLTI